jgi:hypothetical protein
MTDLFKDEGFCPPRNYAVMQLTDAEGRTYDLPSLGSEGVSLRHVKIIAEMAERVKLEVVCPLTVPSSEVFVYRIVDPVTGASFGWIQGSPKYKDETLQDARFKAHEVVLEMLDIACQKHEYLYDEISSFFKTGNLGELLSIYSLFLGRYHDPTLVAVIGECIGIKEKLDNGDYERRIKELENELATAKKTFADYILKHCCECSQENKSGTDDSEDMDCEWDRCAICREYYPRTAISYCVYCKIYTCPNCAGTCCEGGE